MIESASKGNLKFLYSIGGNLLETKPDRSFVAGALEKVSVRVHQDIVLNSAMLLDVEQSVLVLPGQPSTSSAAGGTSTSTEKKNPFYPRDSGTSN
jgi:predicted molibdopterin-dependent oxidoreductase YjgC